MTSDVTRKPVPKHPGAGSRSFKLSFQLCEDFWTGKRETVAAGNGVIITEHGMPVAGFAQEVAQPAKRATA